MFGLGFTEILVILLVALIVFGPDKLPEVARNLGKALGEFRRTVDEIRFDITTSTPQSVSKSLTDKPATGLTSSPLESEQKFSKNPGERDPEKDTPERDPLRK